MSSRLDIPFLTTLLHLKPCYQMNRAVLRCLKFITVITLENDGKIKMQILGYNLIARRSEKARYDRKCVRLPAKHDSVLIYLTRIVNISKS